MSKFKIHFTLAHSGWTTVGEYLKGEHGMEEIMKDYAQEVLNNCGNGYKISDLTIGEKRSNIKVMASTYQAKADNSKNNTLLKALGGAKK